MKFEVHMPKLGMTMKEGRIVKWLKNEGDRVDKGDKLVEIMSEKIANTVEALNGGILTEIRAQEGDVVEIGAVIAIISAEEQSSKATETQETKEQAWDEVNKKMQLEKGGKVIKEIKPLPPVRKMIGEKMRESLRNVPQGTLTTKLDLSQLLAFKKELKERKQKVTMTDLFVKVLGLALAENPVLNSSIIDDNWIFYESVNIGVGVPTDEALYTPVIKNVQTRSLLEISQELRELVAKVRKGTISIDETTGSTFTLSNLGMFEAIDIITPIINTPESAIMTIGATRREPVVGEDDKIEIKPMATLSLTVDHTNVDGIPVVNFIETIKKIAQNPSDFLQ